MVAVTWHRLESADPSAFGSGTQGLGAIALRMPSLSNAEGRANLSEGNQTLVSALTAKPILSARSSVSDTEAS